MKPRKRPCEAQVSNLYGSVGTGETRPCAHPAKPGSDFCKRHGKGKPCAQPK